jgi:Zn finger protein HypA/HybF involved in hydrogenase expression
MSANRHELKTDPLPFADILSGEKTHEIRVDDRDFKVGDTLVLRETRYSRRAMREEGRWLEYTGREVERVVTHIQRGYGLPDGLVVMSLALAWRPIASAPRALDADAGSLEVSAAPKEWRCFHCDEVFTDEAAARAHFGSYGPRILSEPACQIDAAEYRAMERRMADYNAEDADIHRQMARMEHEHKTALRREEEKGYARGLADAVKYPNDLIKAPLDPLKATTVAEYVQAVNDVAERDLKPCWCAACRPITLADMRFIVCPTCGNKRCPRATSCAYKCSGSNEPNQKPEHV